MYSRGIQWDTPSHLEPAPSLDDLNKEHRFLVEAMLQSVNYAEAGNEPDLSSFNVDAPRGSGKTYIFNTLAAYLQHCNKNVLCVVWTGTAAILMSEGRTVHSLFKLQCVSNFKAC